MSVLASAFGFDRDVLARLPPRSRTSLQRVAWLGVLSAVSCGISAAYGAWLATGSGFAGVGAASFFSLFIWNLHRLLVAGTGVPLDLPPSATLHWRPGKAPLVAFGVFAVIAAQPSLLLVDGASSDGAVEEHRRMLLERHARTVLGPLETRLGELDGDLPGLRARLAVAERRLAEAPPADATPEKRTVDSLRTTLAETEALRADVDSQLRRIRSEEVDAYRAHLATIAFPVLRLQLAWARPARAGMVSAAFAVLVLLPVLARRLGVGGFRDYEFERHDLLRAVVDAEHAAWREEMAPLVARYVGWAPLPGPFEDHVRASRLVVGKVTGRALLERIGGEASS